MPERSIPVDTSWTIAPAVFLTVLVYAGVYLWRWRKVRAAAGAARGGAAAGGAGRAAAKARAAHDAGWGRLALWLGGLTFLLAALVSPLDRISEQLASGHMIQHLLLADIVPIMLILAFTKVLLRPVTRQVHALERKAGWFAHPVFGVIAYVGTMWFWHVPVFYDAALDHELVHVAEHLSFAASGGLYWWHLISPIRSRLRLGGMAPVAYMTTTKLLVGALGVWLAFYPELIYDGYALAAGEERWGMSPVDDQHVAGLIMGLEQSIVMGIGLAYLFARMLTESEAADRRDELREERGTSAAIKLSDGLPEIEPLLSELGFTRVETDWHATRSAAVFRRGDTSVQVLVHHGTLTVTYRARDDEPDRRTVPSFAALADDLERFAASNIP